MKYIKEEILAVYNNEMTKTEAAKLYAKQKGYEYSDKVRRRVANIINEHLNDSVHDDNLENETTTTTNQYNSNVSQLSALKEDGTIMSIKEYCNHYNIPFEEVRTYKLVTHTAKGAYYNIASNNIKGEHFEEFYKKLLDEIREIETRPKTIVRKKPNNEGHLLVVSPADIHLGKLCDSFETGEDYNNQIAVKRVKEGVSGIIEKSKGFNIEKIIFIAGNDILHIDTPKRTTTSGTPQDTDGQWYSNFLLAKQLYIELITQLLEIADVHVMYNPSNHDYQSGFFLADVIKTYFENMNNITFDTSISHRKYYKYDENLIGSTHGDGAKQQDLPMLMAHESKDWSNCKHRYIYGHHVHHKISKDYIGVTFEALRSPSGTDSWHHRNGYTGVPKAIEGFVHHPKFGQVARLTHIF